MADTNYEFAILGANPGQGGNNQLSTSDLEAVRGALGLDASDIPDELVHENTHAPAAEMQIVRDFPTAASQVDDDLIQVVTACRLLTASYIARHVPARIAKQERIEGALTTINPTVDWLEVATRLKDAAYAALYLVPAYVTLVYGEEIDSADIPGLPLARANGLSRAQIATGTYPGFVVR